MENFGGGNRPTAVNRKYYSWNGGTVRGSKCACACVCVYVCGVLFYWCAKSLSDRTTEKSIQGRWIWKLNNKKTCYLARFDSWRQV